MSEAVSDQSSAVSEEEGVTEARTQEDRWRAHIGRQIADLFVELSEMQDKLADRESKLEDAKAAVSDVKAEIAGVNAKLKSYAGQMRDIENGTFTPPLFDKHTGETLAQAGKPQTVDQNDVGALTPLERLIDYGLTGSMIKALQGSQLALKYPLATVADLEKVIRDDEWWHKQIKGFGDAKVEKLVDSLMLFRKENPVGESDTRPKQCRDVDCRASESQGIFVKQDDGGEACPSCGNSKYWDRYEGAEEV